MIRIKKYFNILYRWRYFWIVTTLISYILFASYYMTPSVISCKDTVYGFGDSTGGPIWNFIQSRGSFLPGNTSATNYPDVDNLYSPVMWTSMGQRAIFWPLAKIAGPVCGYNLMIIVGLISTALIMFLFVYWLFKNKWIAWIAGYAVAFAPYIQLRIGTGPSYAFSGILIGIFWLLISIIKKPTMIKAIALGLLVSFCVYFDPYFVLYGFLTGLSVIIAWLIYIIIKKVRKNDNYRDVASFYKVFKSLLLSAIIVIVTTTPYIYTMASSRNDIQKQVSAVRGNVLFEAIACSNYPYEYLLPFVLHPIPKLIGVERAYIKTEINLKNNFSCGIGEDTVGVSLVALSLIAITGLFVFWDKLNRRKIKLISQSINFTKFILLSTTSLLLIGVLFGLPPTDIMGVPTPTKIMLDMTTTWRTLARVFMLVNISVIIFASYALYYYSGNKNIPKKIKIFCFVTIGLLMFIEYQSFPPLKGNLLSTFSYKKDTPYVYDYIRDNKEIESIVEYPIESYGESDAPTYYISMQVAHGKKLLNSPVPGSSLENLRRSIKNINDPQTIPALGALGIDAIIVHGANQNIIDKYKTIEISGVFTQPKFGINSHTSITNNDKSIVLNTKQSRQEALIGLLTSGFYRNLGLINYPENWAYEATEGAKIDMAFIKDGKILKNDTARDYCFSIRTSAPKETVEFQPVIDGNTGIFSQIITDTYSSVRIKVKDSIILKNSKGSNVQITNLGCTD